MNIYGKYFMGHEISAYGRANGRVDYATFAKAFDAVLNNDIMGRTWGVCGEWEKESGYIDNSDEIDEINERIEELEAKADELESETTTEEEQENIDKIEELRAKIEELEEERDRLEDEESGEPDVFQWYIISDNGAEICKEHNEIVYYNAELDIYLWGVTHYGTSWDYVLTAIPCEVDGAANA